MDIFPPRARNRFPSVENFRVALCLLAISGALCYMLYQQSLLIAPRSERNYQAFLVVPLSIDFGVSGADSSQDLDKAWKPRILSNCLAGLFARDCIVDAGSGTVDTHKFMRRASLWNALWLGAIFVPYLVAFRGRAVLFLFGTYCGVSFGYLPMQATEFLPWDLPALFFHSLFLVLWIKNKSRVSLFLLPVSVLFKETCLIWAVAYLFADGTRASRLAKFALVAAAGLWLRLAVEIHLGVTGRPLFNPVWLMDNLRHLATHVTPLLANAGIALCCFLLPFKSRHARVLRTIASLSLAAILVQGVVSEYRIWFELIPIGLYAIHSSLSETETERETAPCK